MMGGPWDDHFDEFISGLLVGSIVSAVVWVVLFSRAGCLIF